MSIFVQLFMFVLILLPTRSKTNHECIECCENWIDAAAAHARITYLLEFLEVCTFVAQFTILKAK